MDKDLDYSEPISLFRFLGRPFDFLIGVNRKAKVLIGLLFVLVLYLLTGNMEVFLISLGFCIIGLLSSFLGMFFVIMSEITTNSRYSEKPGMPGKVWMPFVSTCVFLSWGIIALNIVKLSLESSVFLLIFFLPMLYFLVSSVLFLCHKENRGDVYASALMFGVPFLYESPYNFNGNAFVVLGTGFIFLVFLDWIIHSLSEQKLMYSVDLARNSCWCCGVKSRAFYRLCLLGKESSRALMDLAKSTSYPGDFLEIMRVNEKSISSDLDEVRIYLEERLECKGRGA